MDVSEYTELTGITVSDADNALVTAQIARTRSILESLLGFTLDPDKINENLYIELGKSQTECSCSNIDPDNLDDPDDVTYAYRIFPYKFKDTFLHTDPFTDIHAVKLIRNNVTIKTFDLDDIVPRWKDGIAKYLAYCWGDFNFCYCDCDDCVQLAVDADWLWMSDGTLGEIPTDLKYLWAEMVTYYADNKGDIKSETLGTHSYTKFDSGEYTTASGAIKVGVGPQEIPRNMALISKYAGPLGLAYKRTV